ncbi:MAG: hypothetical protein HY869_20955 [Chloroflexi bacterium]|nr:hypothetical protein [Chloroflexota bacterium]
MKTPIPEVVQRLAKTVEPLGKMPVVPLDWRVSDDVVVIVFEDGRKLRFEQGAEGGGQGTEGGRQKAEGGGQEAEGGGQKAEGGRQKAEGAAREKKK